MPLFQELINFLIQFILQCNDHAPIFLLHWFYNFEEVRLHLLDTKSPSRVDLHRPKMLIIQFHTLSLWKNASHRIFIHFFKMSLIDFQRYFIVVLVSKKVSLQKKRKKKWYEKNANHTISIYGNCMISIFFKFFFEKNALNNHFDCW